MFNTIFPYLLQLHIFQLDEYNVGKFIKWIFFHFFTRTIENKKHFVLTSKAQSLLLLAAGLSFIIFLLLTYFFGIVGAAAGIVLATQAYLYLILAAVLLKPYEVYKKNKIKKATERKLASLENLKIIGVTGSYGKTSVKEFLYHILKTKHTVLRTPGSYNTPMGIAKVVDFELDNSYEYFICEMGAYRRGDIKEICDMVHPQYGILTGINEQHIETFGSLESTTLGKFELIASLPKNGFGVVNGDNMRIQNALPNYSQKITTYGFSDKKFSIVDISQNHEGSTFILILDGKKYKASAKLLGRSQLQNILGAATMCYLLGMNPQDIVKAITTLMSVAHRLEIKQTGEMTIIDDAYNSNVDGFQEAIALLSSFDRPTVLVTPGIVDLGKRTIEIHESLGKLLDDVDYIFLIGESDRTKGLMQGIKKKEKVKQLASIRQIWEEIEKLHLSKPVVLLENDLPDNY